MLQSQPIVDITWQDVEDFCNTRIPEGAYVDYKEDFPSNLEKTISAMANTIGGLVILGVEEDTTNRPVVPMKGIELQRGLSERVTNTLLGNVTHPVFPEIAVCPNTKGDRAVVVVRVHESHAAPHAISGNTRVYLRTGDVNQPEARATVEDIQWLINGREKSLNLKQLMLESAESRFSVFYAREVDRLLSQNIDATEKGTGMLTLFTCPVYPRDQLILPPGLRQLRQQLIVRDYYGTFDHFPPYPQLSRIGLPSLVKDGAVIALITPDGDRFFFVELSSFGLYFYRQPAKRKIGRYLGAEREILSGGELIARVDQFLASAALFYDQVGYQGPVEITAKLDQIAELGLSLDWMRSPTELEATLGFSPDDSVAWLDTDLVASLKSNRDKLLQSCLERVCWAFGIEFPESHLASFFEVVKRPKA